MVIYAINKKIKLIPKPVLPINSWIYSFISYPITPDNRVADSSIKPNETEIQIIDKIPQL